MIPILQRLGHRETVWGFLARSAFAVIVMHASAILLTADIVARAIPKATAIATIALGVVMGWSVARRGVALAIAFVALNTLPIIVAGAVLTAFAPPWGGPLLGAPFFFAVGATIGIVSRRRTDGYQNSGSAAAGAAAVFAVFAMGAWLALGAMDGRFSEGVVAAYWYLAEYDVLDPEDARIAGADYSRGHSENNRQRIKNALRSDDPMHARPGEP